MANKGAFLQNGQYLQAGDYLQSPNGFYCAYLFEDGNLCIYSSPTPDGDAIMWASGPQVGLGPKVMYLHDDGNLCIYNSPTPDVNTNIWSSGPQVGVGPKCAFLHDDGNLCLYNSAYTDASKHFWASGSSDPLANVELVRIDYDVAAATILSTGSQGIATLPVVNNTPQTQTSKITLSGSVSETSSWSNTLGGKVGVETEVSAGIPLLAEGKVKVSAEVNYSHTWGGSETRSRAWSVETAVTVPPNQAYVAMGVVSVSTIAVPYTLHVTVVLRSGRKIPGQTIKGIYTGSNSHDFNVKYVVQDGSNGKLMMQNEAVAA